MQFYVQASVGTAMQVPPAIAPGPGPQTTTNTVNTLHHQPLQHHQATALQPINHPGVSPSPMPQVIIYLQFVILDAMIILCFPNYEYRLYLIGFK